MKIVVITNLYPPISRGGAERVAQRIVGELVRRRHNVVVISSMPLCDGAMGPEVRETVGETVYRFYPLNLYHVLKDFKFPYLVRALWHLIDLFSASSAKRIERILSEEKPDVVLTHNLKGIGLRVPRAIQRLGLPWIHTLHDVQLSVPSGLLIYGHRLNPMEMILRPFYEAAVRGVFGKPDLVISPSKFLADFYLARGFFRDVALRVMANPAPEREFSTRGPRQPGPLRILVASQLERHKGILEILEAINLLEFPLELHVAGDGTLAQLIQSRSKEDKRVIYHGFVSSSSLGQLFEIVDTVVVPSKCYENSPTIIYESLQSGLPVIASNIGGVGELIKDGEHGFLVEPGSAEALATAIRKLAAAKDEFRAKSDDIRAASFRYSLKSYVDNLEGAINEIKGRKKPHNP
jgi:glycosyltransferase involved in cell wall biosynthesis